MTEVPASHPRYVSLRTRDAIVAGVEIGEVLTPRD